MTDPREVRRPSEDAEQVGPIDRRALRRSVAALRLLRATLDADPSTRRVPAEYATDSATRALLERIHGAVLGDLDRRDPVADPTAADPTAANPIAADGATDWTAELRVTPMPSRLRFQERRMLEELVDELGEAARMRLARRSDGAVEAELTRTLRVPEDAAAADARAEVALPAGAVPEYEPQWASHLHADRQRPPHRAAAAANHAGSDLPRTPGWLWARIRADLRTLRRAHRADRRMRLASRAALVAAVLIVTGLLWPRSEQPDLHSRIEIIQTDQPLSESYSALAVLRGLHDGGR